MKRVDRVADIVVKPVLVRNTLLRNPLVLGVIEPDHVAKRLNQRVDKLLVGNVDREILLVNSPRLAHIEPEIASESLQLPLPFRKADAPRAAGSR